MFFTLPVRTTLMSLSAMASIAIASPLEAQDITIMAAPEVSALMAACTPIDAQGPAIRDHMMERGWMPVPVEDRDAIIPAFGAALFWSFMPNLPPDARDDNFDRLVAGVTGAASSENASFLSHNGEYVLLLWNGDSLSCIWAGPQTDAIGTLAVQLGGFPESDGVATAGIQQRVEAGGREWARGMSVGRTPVDDLPAAVAGSTITDSARLDRSPL
ncbi:hypothetical protein [Hyphobacterium sp.]|uniref:hypothetical protein n=1 Tax=Hyphobacterium sp. TaxID=2004662 RepID=UPI00374A37A2